MNDNAHNPPSGNRRLRLEFESFRAFVAEYSAKISEEGMFIETDSPHEVGSVIRFEVCLSDDFRLLHGEAEVVWKVDLDASPDWAPGMAVRFREIDEPSRRLIARLVENHEKAGRSRFSLMGHLAEAIQEAPEVEVSPSWTAASPEPPARPRADAPGAPPTPTELAPRDQASFAVVGDEVRRQAEPEAERPGEGSSIAEAPAQGAPSAPEAGPGAADVLSLELPDEFDLAEGGSATDGAAAPEAESVSPDAPRSSEAEAPAASAESAAEDRQPPAASAEGGDAAAPEPFDDRALWPEPERHPAPEGGVPDGIEAVERAPAPQSAPEAPAEIPEATVSPEPIGFSPPLPPSGEMPAPQPEAEELESPGGDRPDPFTVASVRPARRRRGVWIGAAVFLALVGAGAYLARGPLLELYRSWTELAPASPAPTETAGEAAAARPPVATPATPAEAAEGIVEIEGVAAGDGSPGFDRDQPVAGEPVASPGRAPAAAAPPAAEPAPRASRPAPSRPAPAQPRSAAGARVPSVERVAWSTSPGETVVTIVAGAPIGDGAWEVTRLDGGQPRQIVKLRGVERPMSPARLTIGSPEVVRVRSGLHRPATGPEIHLVADLAGPGVRLLATEVDGAELRLRFGSPNR